MRRTAEHNTTGLLVHVHDGTSVAKNRIMATKTIDGE